MNGLLIVYGSFIISGGLMCPKNYLLTPKNSQSVHLSDTTFSRIWLMNRTRSVMAIM